MSPRVSIVIGGHITSCPRMMKIAQALSEEGIAVSIVNPIYSQNTLRADLDFLADDRWQSRPVTFVKSVNSRLYYGTAVRTRLFRYLTRFSPKQYLPLKWLARGYTRAFDELLNNTIETKPDFILGGTAGGIVVAAMASALSGIPFGLDLEDYHSAEQDPSSEANLSHAIIHEIEKRILNKAEFLTVGSDAIGEEYRKAYNVECITINNVFELPSIEPDLGLDPSGVLRLVWLSQTVGPGRGLEFAINSLVKAGIPAKLTLRGTPVSGYIDYLKTLIPRDFLNLKLEHIGPDMTKSVIDLCRGYDVGLALEQSHVLNRQLCLCNKPFTYMLAGLAVVFTDTAGQRTLAKDLGESALLVQIGDEDAFARGLQNWAKSPEQLIQAKKNAWDAGKKRWNWRHSMERGKALELINDALKKVETRKSWA